MVNNNVMVNLNFGDIAAEYETRELTKYFVETPEYKSLAADNRKILVIGRKGSGKSAIYYALQDRFEDQSRGLDLDNYPWSIHKKLRDESGTSDYAYVNTWRYMILVELAKHILEYSRPEQYKIIDKKWWRLRFDSNLRRLRRYLKQNYGTLAPSFGELLVDRARAIKQLNIKSISAEWEDQSGNVAQLLSSINIVTQDLEDLVLNKLPTGHPVYILFDHLDRGWDSTKEFKEMLIGLVLAVRKLITKAQKIGKDLHVVVFLRSDIYAKLRFEDKNKVSSGVVNLRWNGENLKSMINKRIEVSVGKAWEQVVTRSRMRRQMLPFDYIVKRTMLRPRDLIAFCNYARQEAEDSGHSVIQGQDIYQGELSYSDYMKREFQDETRGDREDEEFIDNLFAILREIHVEKFTKDEFISCYSEHKVKGMPDDPNEALEYLIELSILGVYKIGGRGGGSEVIYRYKLAPDTRVDVEGTLVVHPSLKHTLDLVEPRS